MDLGKLVDTIETDLETAWTGLVSEVETIADEVLQAAWNDVGKPILTAVGPTLLADLGALAKAAVAELGAGANLGEVATTLLNMAESQGKQAILSVETNLVTAIASIHLSAAQPPAAP